MSAPALIQHIQASPFGEWMRNSVLAMPFVESTHVLAVALLFGTILVVDLRLIGVLDAGRPVTRLTREMLSLTWAAFAVAVLTGTLMFSANAATYYGNTAFRLKMLALLAAGVNMAVFQLVTFRGIAAWDRGAPPRAARVAGALSLLLWISVIFLGRWIGFTKGYDFQVPHGINFDFSGSGAGP
jgi:hypothetical protein